jgi:hypothetical protein
VWPQPGWPAATPATSHRVPPPPEEPTECHAGSVFQFNPNTLRFCIRPGHTFHLVVSQLPCGDASIVRGPCKSPCGHVSAQANRTGAKPVTPAAISKGALDSSVLGGPWGANTEAGAKCARGPHCAITSATPPGIADRQKVPEASDVEAGVQQPGCLRRKPGKGEATLSMSCRCGRQRHSHCVSWQRASHVR